MPCSVITGKGPGSDKKLRNCCGSLHTSLHVVKVRGCQPPHSGSLSESWLPFLLKGYHMGKKAGLYFLNTESIVSLQLDIVL